jgi:hypothetical protein
LCVVCTILASLYLHSCPHTTAMPDVIPFFSLIDVLHKADHWYRPPL